MSRTNSRLVPIVTAAAASALVLTGCGGQSDPEQGSTESAAPDTEIHVPETESLSADAAANASGDVTLCGGVDNGVFGNLIDSFNDSQSDVTANYVELGANTDAARTAAVQRLEGGSTDCDAYLTDVTWTAEWATQGWLYDQTDYLETISDGIISSAVDTTEYGGRNWSTPFYTNAALLFYRTDRAEEASSWRNVAEQAGSAPDNKLIIQLKPYEGLTVGFLELLYSNGGSVLDENGNITIDSEQTREVLEFLKDGLENGSIDRASLTYDEAETRRAFESGEGGFQRNWPNVYTTAMETDVADVLGVQPLPAFSDGTEAAGVIGGWNLGIAHSANNPDAAAALLQYAVSPEFQHKMFLENAQAPVLSSVYSEPEIQEAIPFATELRDSLENAQPRPKSSVYPQISRAIYSHVYAVLNEGAEIEDAIQEMVAEIEAAQETF